MYFAAGQGNLTNVTNTTSPDSKEDVGYAAVTLLGATAFIMLIFYLANAHVKQIQSQTWSMLAAAVSIFVAVMTNNVINFIISHAFGLKDDDGDTPPGFGEIFSSVLQVLGYWVIVTSLLFCFRTSVIRLKGYGTIGGHIMGFASIGLWTKVCALSPFRTSAWWILPVVLLIYLLCMSCFVVFFRNLGSCLAKASKSVSEADEDRWHEQSSDTGTDFISLGMAFITTTWIKFLIWGEFDPALTDAKKSRDPGQVWILAIVAFVFMILSIGMTFVGHSKGTGCVTDVLTTVFATISAMCWLDTWNWWLMPGVAELIGRLRIAITLSMLAVLGVLLVGFSDRCCNIAKRALRGAFTGFALAVGSSWEKTFDASVDALEEFGVKGLRKTLITLLLVCIVFPAWMSYILPKSDADLQKEYKGKTPPFWACCCDYDPCEDEEDDYENADAEDIE
jgi:hypothetical protein